MIPLDPANNAIKYTDTSSAGDIGDFYYWVQHENISRSSSAAQSCRLYLQYISSSRVFIGVTPFTPSSNPNLYFFNCEYKVTADATDIRTVQGRRIGEVTGSSDGEEKYLPIDTVAAQVISNAEAGHAPSQEAVKATALEGFAAGEHDAALDAAAIIDN